MHAQILKALLMLYQNMWSGSKDTLCCAEINQREMPLLLINLVLQYIRRE